MNHKTLDYSQLLAAIGIVITLIITSFTGSLWGVTPLVVGVIVWVIRKMESDYQMVRLGKNRNDNFFK